MVGKTTLLVASLLTSGLQAATQWPTGKLVEKVACLNDASQTYTLYLPSGYDGKERRPLLLIFDPRGRGAFAAEFFRQAAEEYGWILMSSDNTRSDGPWEPNARAVSAMWPEAHQRFRSDPARIYAAGFSGGAIVAWSLAQQTHQIAGIIGAGGRLPPEIPTERIEFAHYGAAGVHDFNFQEMREIDRLLEDKNVPHRLEIFEGGHRWLSKDLAADALRWMELVAMQKGIRERDQELITLTYQIDAQRGRELEQRGQKLQAARHWQMVADTYAGLRDTSHTLARAQALKADRETRRAERDEKRWDAWESDQIRHAQWALGRLVNPTSPHSSTAAIKEIGIPDLKKRARVRNYAGDASQRILESIHVQTSFYLSRQFFEQKRYRDAAAVLEIALAIREDPRSWYNLGAAQARMGQHKPALQSLERAIQRGFSDAAHLLADQDYAALRSSQRFKTLVENLR